MNISPTLENSAVKRIFAERKDFIIIGLTGRTGSGCTTVAKLLSKEFSALQPPKDFSGDLIESREDTIVYEYAERSWTPFRLIEMKHVIFTFILEENYDAFVSFVRDSVNLSVDLQKLETPFNLLHEKRIKLMGKVSALTSKGENVPDSDELYSFYFDEVPQFYEQFQASIPRAYYTKILQTIGDNIRASGSAYSREIKPDCILRLSQRVNMLIKILRRRNLKEKKQVLIVIDAFRNPYEATFFKDRYSAFYLFAINTIEEERRRRLFSHGLTIDDIAALDKKEYPSLNNTIQDFYQINIEKTIEIADVHIYNPFSESRSFSETKRQLIRYISLIMHPGIVQPSKIERCMQVAYDCKLNSGCLSRQVGAVISDSEFNIYPLDGILLHSTKFPVIYDPFFH